MPDSPSPEFKPEDVDGLIKSYGKALEPSKKEALMDKLRAEQVKIQEREAKRPGNSQDNAQDRGR